ncbi:MAG: nitroreductase family protein, partial [Flavobacteriaceae bacterium]
MASKILERLEWRYATKKFDENKKLSEEKLSTIKEAFNLTATSYGLQPLKLVVVSNPEKIKELVPMSYNQGQVGNASNILVICTETKVDEKYIRNYFDLVEKTRNTPRDVL